jgi:hypothetical protein
MDLSMMTLTSIDMHVKSDTKHERNRPSYVLIEIHSEALTIQRWHCNNSSKISYPSLSWMSQDQNYDALVDSPPFHLGIHSLYRSLEA